MSRILIVDDEVTICWALRESLEDDGHHVDVAASVEEGLRITAQSPPDAVILDVRLPGTDGLTAMPAIRERIGRAPIIVITAYGNLETAVKAMEGGAFDYLVKPFDLDQATTTVGRALEMKNARRCVPALAASDTSSDTLIGASPAMQDVFKKIALVAPTDVPVLVTGESGTGKELVARAIHAHSSRRGAPFLPVCVAALSPSLVERELFGHVRGSFTGATDDRPGLLELACGGTVLLDEVAEIAPEVQVKLLRAIEHRAVTPVGDARPRTIEIRLVAATNRPLDALMAAGQFREDLFFRLSVFQIHLPPLRERRDDIGLLAEHFLRQSTRTGAASACLSQELLEELTRRPWAGNVRELRNAIEHAAIVARGGAILPTHLPPATVAANGPLQPLALKLQNWLADWVRREAAVPSGEPALYERFLELFEPPVLKAVLEQCRSNRAAAAVMLGVHRATLRQKLRKYGIE
jgi:two-component system nitrogen regulation response regulator GlnG